MQIQTILWTKDWLIYTFKEHKIMEILYKNEEDTPDF